MIHFFYLNLVQNSKLAPYNSKKLACTTNGKIINLTDVIKLEYISLML